MFQERFFIDVSKRWRAVDPVQTIVDELITNIQEHFKAFLLALICQNFGRETLRTISPNASFSTTVGLNIEIEPIKNNELLSFDAKYPNYIVDIFQAKFVQYLVSAINQIFIHYLNLHISGERGFVELGTCEVKFDFRRSEDLSTQASESLIRDFDFRKFSEKIKLINKLRNNISFHLDEVQIIHKHVQFRNAIQHQHGILHEFVFKELGYDSIEILDNNGNIQRLKIGDAVQLSVSELDKFRRAILILGQKWRADEQN